ncbi:hypothetical protein FAZ95_00865 [Trinickia violacea]|uniref:Uncharacterized protein n=1 Tax=Trinickia violacea TaxID=2571746 RepID=A0A4V1EGT2_9BURK|nr:hypothetical protein [Trinickia violacea]QCP47860.1 hypothetical protein FAZ95_00865 [Trinickia violacea]
MVVTQLIAVLKTRPPDARVIVQDNETAFNKTIAIVIQLIVVTGGYRKRDCLGSCVAVHQAGGGEHELLARLTCHTARFSRAGGFHHVPAR